MNPGKRFERAFKASMDAIGYAVRIPDKCYLSRGRLMSERSEGDFRFFAESGHSFLVECKATGCRSLPFANVGAEQELELLRFERVGPMCHGVLALNFYGPMLREKNSLYLVGIEDYLAFKDACGRKSLPERTAARIGRECPRVKGGIWGLPFQENPWKGTECTDSERSTGATSGKGRGCPKG